MKKTIKRNRHKQFFYLRHPTFICQVFKNWKFYYKCFGCRKLFPTQYRLSRHFLETKCLKNKAIYNINTLPKKLKIREFIFDDKINDSSLLIIQEEYNKKKKEQDSYYYDNDSHKKSEKGNIDVLKELNDNNKFIFYKNNERKRYIFQANNILGEGHFGKVFCVHHYKNNSLIALKYFKKFSNRIIIENSILRILNDVEGIPKIIDIEELENKNNFIAQELCGPSLEKLHFYCGNKFSEYTIIKIAIKLIDILKNIHKKGILHRDLKPSNICYGLFSKNQFIKSLYLIDFNLGSTFQYNHKKYIPEHINKFVGTLLFANSAALSMIEQSPKDELETLFYVLAYLKNGFLPWQKFQNLEKHEYIKEVLKLHKSLAVEELFEGFSAEVIFIFKAIKNLSYNDIPDYDIYIKLLESLAQKAEKNKKSNENKFDWEIQLKEDFSNYIQSKAKKKDYIKLAFLKRGYPFNSPKLIKLFS